MRQQALLWFIRAAYVFICAMFVLMLGMGSLGFIAIMVVFGGNGRRLSVAATQSAARHQLPIAPDLPAEPRPVPFERIPSLVLLRCPYCPMEGRTYARLFALNAFSILFCKSTAANNLLGCCGKVSLVVFFGSDFIAAVIAVLVRHFRGISYATKQQPTAAVSAPVHVGGLIGAIVCVWLASRPSVGPPPIVGPTEPPPVPLESIPQRIQQDVRVVVRSIAALFQVDVISR